MNKLKGMLTICLSAVVIGGTALGLYCAMRSELFTVRTVEVDYDLENPPINTQAIIKLAAVPVGRVSLFELDLKRIERRLLSNEWIDRVTIQKKPRHTLSIYVNFRVPKALYQRKRGGLAYVDHQGNVFGNVNMSLGSDLPMISGISELNSEKLREAIQLCSQWEKSDLGKMSMISTVFWEEERGFRALVSYAMGNQGAEVNANYSNSARTMIDFGHEINANLDGKLFQLLNVFRYLSGNSIAVRQVWADAGKKIVVKTVHGS